MKKKKPSVGTQVVTRLKKFANKLKKELKNPELAYHNRCREIAKALGGKLDGSSINGGFSFFDNAGGHNEISHATMLVLEKALANDKTRLMEFAAVMGFDKKGFKKRKKNGCTCDCRDCTCQCHTQTIAEWIDNHPAKGC